MIVNNLAKVNWALIKDLDKIEAENQKAEAEQAKALLTKARANLATVLPQLMAFLNSSITLVRTDTGKIDLTLTLSKYTESIKQDRVYYQTGESLDLPSFLGMLSFMAYKTRGAILPIGVIQSRDWGVRWAANVPLFFSAFKEFRDVGYEEWDWEGASQAVLKKLLDTNNLEIINSRVNGLSHTFDNQTLLTIRDNALPIRSGANSGSLRNPISCTTVYGYKTVEPLFEEFPNIIRVLLTQLWVFHPSLRHKLGLYSITNLDGVPENLVDDGAVLEPVKGKPNRVKVKEKPVAEDLPWDIVEPKEVIQPKVADDFPWDL